MDLSTEEYLDVTTEQYPDGTTETSHPVGHETQMWVMATYICIGIVGILGNGIVVFVIFNSSMKKKVTNLFIMNQSMIDFVASVLLVASAPNSFHEHDYSGLSGLLYCKLWYEKMPLWAMFMSSSYNLVAITLERYMEVIHPISHRVHFTRQKAIAIIVVIWFLGLTYEVPYIWFTSDVIDGVCYYLKIFPSDAVHKLCGCLAITLEFLLPLFIMIVAYTRMAASLKSRTSRVAPNGETTMSDADKKREQRMAKARLNVIKVLVSVVAAYFLCWIIEQIFFLLLNLGYPVSFGHPIYHIGVFLAFANCCINPFLYAWQFKEFKAEARKMLSRVFPSLRQENKKDDLASTAATTGDTMH